MKTTTKEKLAKLRKFADGKADTRYELFMLFVIIVNIVSLGIETSKLISPVLRNVLFWLDQGCLLVFVLELLLKIIAYNRDFFGEKLLDDYGEKYFHINVWNISDLLIVTVSIFSSLSFFGVFRVFRVFSTIKDLKLLRSLRIIKSLKLVNETKNLRTTFNGIVKAIPELKWTFFFLALFTYSYAVIGTHVFSENFPQSFGTLRKSLLSLCPIIPLNAWFSGIARDVIRLHPWAWIYFISYAFIAASIIMNVIVGIFVNSMAKEREKEKQSNSITILELSRQISELSSQITELKSYIEKQEETP